MKRVPSKVKKKRKTKKSAAIRSLRGKYKHLDLMKGLMESRGQDRQRQSGKKRNVTELRAAATAKRMLTSTQAAELGSYTRDHIGLLLRRKTVQGKKLGRDWIVDAASLHDYVKKNPRPGPSAG